VSRLSAKRLADFSHRLAVAGEAGVDIRRTWQREADAARGPLQEDCRLVAEEVKSGGSLSDAIDRTGNTFPTLWRDMLGIGEQTGQLPEVLHRLSRHYQLQHQLKQTFIGLIAWPAIQLGLAIVIIGLLIWVLGFIGNGQIDPLGFGLIGTRGLVIYVLIVGSCVAGATALYAAATRGALWLPPVQIAVTSLFGIGDAIQKICLARIAWALHLTLNVEMDLRQLIPLVLRASGNAYYTQHTQTMVADIASGRSMYETFLRAHAFPPQFLDALQVAEESGQINESMARLAKVYEQEAESAMKTLANIAGTIVWLAVASVLVFFIFRLFTQAYLKPMQDALDFANGR
jgi:type IV pilus assembly protein PilC